MDIGSIVFCLTLGALIVFASIGIGVCFGRINRHNQGKPDGDNDIRIYVPCRVRDRQRNHGSPARMDPQEVINVLYLFRIGACAREKQVIDYLIDKEEQINENN